MEQCLDIPPELPHYVAPKVMQEWRGINERREMKEL